DAANPRAKSQCRRRRSQPDAQGLVRLLQARLSEHLPRTRPDDPAAPASHVAQAGTPPGRRKRSSRPSTMAQCLLRECRAVRASHGLAISETVSMKKPPTGEPYARKPPVRFGGRGRCKPIPTPIILRVRALWHELRDLLTS